MNKEEQKKLLIEIMEADERDGLYEINNMKLYTEEQVREAYLSGMYVTVSFEEVMQRLTPIELPSDEEIENYVQDSFTNCVDVQKYTEKVQLLMKAMCRAGMKGMRNKIKGGNNEQQ